MTAPAAKPVIRPPTEQEDLFLKPGGNLQLRMDRVLMEFPFFSVQKRTVTTKTVFRMGETTITIKPGSDGQATVWDQDLLRYAISKLNEKINRREAVSPTLVFVAHDFLKQTNRGTGKHSYELLRAALSRLSGTRIETNIPSGGSVRISDFGWLVDWDLLGDDDGAGGIKRLKGVKMTLAPWVYDAITKDRRVLAFSPEYFSLTGGLERRLYDIARKFCGKQKKPFKVGLANLHQRVGTTQPLKSFRSDLNKIIERDDLPDYRYTFLPDSGAELSSMSDETGTKGKRVRRLDQLVVMVTRRSKDDTSLDDEEEEVIWQAEDYDDLPSRQQA